MCLINGNGVGVAHNNLLIGGLLALIAVHFDDIHSLGVGVGAIVSLFFSDNDLLCVCFPIDLDGICHFTHKLPTLGALTLHVVQSTLVLPHRFLVHDIEGLFVPVGNHYSFLYHFSFLIPYS
eukprot:TRINITY_DN37131_c0_g1_i1.p1 TRINITY_DN37131_c0_g1~~TRINITY_DN37131_c0_g1_i1.p1  ORF type:complete len:122 (+),score=17.12 TRINITY_DN37131_c0_g1_i1:57-422(+)